jgi:cytochrome c-type biogenesis protein CcmH
VRAAALGGVLALAAVAVVLTLTQSAVATDAERTDALAAELRCPDCQGLSVSDSQTSAAREIRRQIHELVAAGAGDDEVRSHFTSRYGEWILLAPSSPWPWVIPFVALGAGLFALAAWLVGRRPRAATAPPSLTDEQRRRLHDEAEALDA